MIFCFQFIDKIAGVNVRFTRWKKEAKTNGVKKELRTAIAVLGLCMLVFGCTKTAESENSKSRSRSGWRYTTKKMFMSARSAVISRDEIFQYEKDHPGVEIRKKIADAKGSQQEQNDQIDQFISLDYDLLLVNIVDRTNAAVIIVKADGRTFRLCFSTESRCGKTFSGVIRIYYEGSDAKQSAILQRQM